jgi:predicted transcriptional regulator of viral defense system
MLKIKGNNPQYFSINIMKKVAKDNIITTHNFVKEMKRLGYASPRSYICRYLNKGLLKKIGRGKYMLLTN